MLDIPFLSTSDDADEAEGPGLERILRLLDLRGGLADLAALQDLHVEGGEEAERLAEAALRLERLLDDLAETSTRAELPMLIPAADRHLARNLDGAIRWVGARTQDLHAQVRRAMS